MRSLREDGPLVTGAARFAADVPAHGALHAAFVRSPVAHARITGCDTGRAAGLPGVAAVVRGRDLDLKAQPASGLSPGLARPVLADEVVRFAGEPVAVAVADDPVRAADAAAACEIGYDTRPAVVDPLRALEPGSPVLFPAFGSNVVFERDSGFDDVDLSAADVVARTRVAHPRVAPVPIDAGGVLAVPDGDRLKVWVGAQEPFTMRDDIAASLGLDAGQVRVVLPAIGGGFGGKLPTYPEYVVVAALALHLQRPVRYTQTRSENLVAMIHGRGQIHDIEIGAQRDGTLVGLRVHALMDMGAYPGQPDRAELTTTMLSGAYRLPQVGARVRGVVTNTTPTRAYRGVGRAEAAAAVERAVDLVSGELGLDPVEVRRRNLIAADAYPYTTATGATYDSGDLPHAMNVATEAAGYGQLRAAQARRRRSSGRRHLGIGVAAYVNVTGWDAEFASVEVRPDGRVTVAAGTAASGQGHATVWTQLVHDVLGVGHEAIEVLPMDTAAVPRAHGSWGSRSAQTAGSAVLRAAQQLRDQSATGAARPLSATVTFDQGTLTYPFGVHIAVVEVDADTGRVEVLRYVAVDDCGSVVHPAIVDGQVHGGVAQGIGEALCESVEYAADGTPLTGTLEQYKLPGAAELPAVESIRVETPATSNPLGAKGIGECGVIGAVAAVHNAVIDAVAHFGVRHIDRPLTPERVWSALHDVGDR